MLPKQRGCIATLPHFTTHAPWCILIGLVTRLSLDPAHAAGSTW